MQFFFFFIFFLFFSFLLIWIIWPKTKKEILIQENPLVSAEMFNFWSGTKKLFVEETKIAENLSKPRTRDLAKIHYCNSTMNVKDWGQYFKLIKTDFSVKILLIYVTNYWYIKVK